MSASSPRVSTFLNQHPIESPVAGAIPSPDMFIDSEDELPAEQLTQEQVVSYNVIDQQMEFPVLNDSEIDEFCEFINFSSHSDCDLIKPISPLSTGTLGEWGKNSI